nr:pVI protein [Lemur mastadenovirus]
MEEINFSALAPRRGTRPMLRSWSDIGNSQMNGGAFNWGSLWSGLKNFGSSVKNWGSKAWNSSTGQMLRDKLKDTKVQEKLVDGITAGIHGAIDIGRQELDKAIEQRLDRPVVPTAPPEEDDTLSKLEVRPKDEVVITDSKKRPRDEEEIVVRTDEPPSYEEIFGNNSAPPLRPMTRPIPSMARPVRPAPAPAPAPAPVVDVPTTLDLPPPTRRLPLATTRRSNWQSTLGNIVGVGVRSIKRKRCY